MMRHLPIGMTAICHYRQFMCQLLHWSENDGMPPRARDAQRRYCSFGAVDQPM
jgi:hypothetical protein